MGCLWIEPGFAEGLRRAPRFAPRALRGCATRARRAKRGGARRDRTADLVIANDALSQLSYGPFCRPLWSMRPTTGRHLSPRQGQVKDGCNPVLAIPAPTSLVWTGGNRYLAAGVNPDRSQNFQKSESS